MFQRMTADEAVLLVKDGDRICFNGQHRIAVAERFYKALADRFSATGHPRDLRYYASSSFPALSSLAPHQHDGLISEMIIAHYLGARPFWPAILAEDLAAYALPQGVISLNYHAAAARHPGFLSKIGLKTMYDPRYGKGGGLNKRSDQQFAELVTINGEEFLYYKTLYPDVCVLRGTTCDPNGNITMEREAGLMDTVSIATATRNNGGKVIVQVERFSDKIANPHDVKIPGFLVDVVYDDPDQVMNDEDVYNPILAGEERFDESERSAVIEGVREKIMANRKPMSRYIARRAAMELKKNATINIGFGVPMLVPCEAFDMGYIDTSSTLTLETGAVGGIPLGHSFASVLNADMFMEQADMFRFYEGRGIDFTCVGALEIDQHGNTNVFRKGDLLIGVGGFNYVTYGSQTVLMISPFMNGSNLTYENGKAIVTDGKASKFCEEVEYLNFSAERALEENQRVLYITERCVFQLTRDGLELIEIAPGLDLEKDILSKLPFMPKISENLKEMPWECFEI